MLIINLFTILIGVQSLKKQEANFEFILIAEKW